MTRAWLAGALVLSLSLLARATSLAPLDVATLSAHADLIVQGRVTSAEARQLPSGRIVTFHRVEVGEVLQGAPRAAESEAGAVIVGLPGGLVGEYGQRVHGAPILYEGERVVLFLGRPDGPGGARGVVGMHQGVFHMNPGSSILLPPAVEGEAPVEPVRPPATLEELKGRLRSGR